MDQWKQASDLHEHLTSVEENEDTPTDESRFEAYLTEGNIFGARKVMEELISTGVGQDVTDVLTTKIGQVVLKQRTENGKHTGNFRNALDQLLTMTTEERSTQDNCIQMVTLFLSILLQDSNANAKQGAKLNAVMEAFRMKGEHLRLSQDLYEKLVTALWLANRKEDAVYIYTEMTIRHKMVPQPEILYRMSVKDNELADNLAGIEPQKAVEISSQCTHKKDCGCGHHFQVFNVQALTCFTAHMAGNNPNILKSFVTTLVQAIELYNECTEGDTIQDADRDNVLQMLHGNSQQVPPVNKSHVHTTAGVEDVHVEVTFMNGVTLGYSLPQGRRVRDLLKHLEEDNGIDCSRCVLLYTSDCNDDSVVAEPTTCLANGDVFAVIMHNAPATNLVRLLVAVVCLAIDSATRKMKTQVNTDKANAEDCFCWICGGSCCLDGIDYLDADARQGFDHEMRKLGGVLRALVSIARSDANERSEWKMCVIASKMTEQAVVVFDPEKVCHTFKIHSAVHEAIFNSDDIRPPSSMMEKEDFQNGWYQMGIRLKWSYPSSAALGYFKWTPPPHWKSASHTWWYNNSKAVSSETAVPSPSPEQPDPVGPVANWSKELAQLLDMGFPEVDSQHQLDVHDGVVEHAVNAMFGV